jgi:hypothetical protein
LGVELFEEVKRNYIEMYGMGLPQLIRSYKLAPIVGDKMTWLKDMYYDYIGKRPMNSNKIRSKIFTDYVNGFNMPEIARKNNVHVVTVYRILIREFTDRYTTRGVKHGTSHQPTA